MFRMARKRYSSVWGISQTLEDFVGTEYQPKPHGPGIVKNSSIKIVGPQPGDVSALVNHLFLNEVAISEVKRFTWDDPNNQFTYDEVEKAVAALLESK